MAIKLWGRLSSANIEKVVWTLEELELPYEHEIGTVNSAASTIRITSP